MEGERCAGGGVVEQMNGESCAEGRAEQRLRMGTKETMVLERRQWSWKRGNGPGPEGTLESFPDQFAFMVSSFISPTTLKLCWPCRTRWSGHSATFKKLFCYISGFSPKISVMMSVLALVPFLSPFPLLTVLVLFFILHSVTAMRGNKITVSLHIILKIHMFIIGI